MRHERRNELAQPGHERRHELAQPGHVARHRMSDLHLEQHRHTNRKQTNVQNHRDKTDPMRLQRNALAERFKNATKKIIKKLKNTRRFFNEERRVLNETKEYRDGMPRWLPAMNFVDIHFFNYRSPRRPGATVTEKKVSKYLLLIYL